MRSIVETLGNSCNDHRQWMTLLMAAHLRHGEMQARLEADLKTTREEASGLADRVTVLESMLSRGDRGR